MLKALLDSTKDENARKEIEDILFNIDKYNDLKLTDQTKIKLKPIKSDNDQFMLLMKNDYEGIDKNSNIFINYDYMKRLIQRTSQNGMSVKDILSGIKKLTSAVIILDPNEDEPQVVFESINSTGLDLSLADLIRNFILMTDKNQEKLFENYWIKIESNVGTKKMPSFITDFLQFSCRETVTTQNAYDIFKNYFKSSGFTNKELLMTLLKYSEYYKTFLYCSDAKYSKAVNKSLAGLRALDQGTIYQFLFHIFRDFDDQVLTMDELEKVMTFFFNYLLRRTVCGVGSNSLRGLYKTLYNRIFADKDNLTNYYDAIVQFFMQLNTKDAIPSDSMFKVSLLNVDLYNKKNLCKYLLKSIEDVTDSGQESKELLDVSTFSIKHIMPQTLSDWWKKSLGENYEKTHEKYVHNIGNLTLTGYNSELRQKTFEEKKQLIKNNSRIVSLNKDILNQDIWDETAIKNRANNLSRILLKLFIIEKPIKYIRFIDETERRLSIGENFDATGTKPKSCILLGNNFNVSSYADMLEKVINLLYELNPKTIEELAKNSYKIPNATKIYITNDANQLRRASEIQESGIFFETHLSSNGIISFLKNLFDEFELEYAELMLFMDVKNNNTENLEDFELKNVEQYQNLKIGKLSEKVFEKLFAEELISDTEIINLLNKEYSKKTFGLYYPVLAFNREDNRYNSQQIRYKSHPYTYKGKEYYLTREWFEENRNKLIEYIKNI